MNTLMETISKTTISGQVARKSGAQTAGQGRPQHTSPSHDASYAPLFLTEVTLPVSQEKKVGEENHHLEMPSSLSKLNRRCLWT